LYHSIFTKQEKDKRSKVLKKEKLKDQKPKRIKSNKKTKGEKMLNQKRRE